MHSTVIAPPGSFKRQIILTFAAGFLVLVSAFAVYIVASESAQRFRDKRAATIGLAQSLAVSSLSWVLANDVAGLEEVVQSFRDYPDLRHAMVISPGGRVLAHNDAAKVGLFLADEASAALIGSKPSDQVITDSASLLDVAVPIEINGRLAAWARIGVGQEILSGEVRKMAWSSALFVLLATCLSLAAAFLIANKLGRHIGVLMNLADEVQSGHFASRADVPGAEYEISRLAASLNQMLDALERNENRLRAVWIYNRSLIEATLDPLIMISADGKITDVNSATEAATGRNRAELFGTDFASYFTEPEKARASYEQVFAKGFITDYPLALRHADGKVVDVLYNASVYRSESGAVLGVIAAARDVTKRKKAEAELTQLSVRHRLILDSVGEGIYGLDTAGRCTFVNPAALELLGFSASEITGQGCHALFHHTRPDGSPYPKEECPVQAAQERGVPFRGTGVYWRKDGSSFPVDVVSTPVVEAGKITGAVVAFSDITERRRAEEELHRYKDHLESIVEERTAELQLARDAAETANKAKSVFLANMSHELRTPLNAILGFSSLLRREPEVTAAQLESLEIINRSGEHLLKLINDVLEMAKIEAGRLQLEIAPFDLGGMVRDVTDMMRMRAQEKGLTLHLDQSSTFPRYIKGDEARLRQILVNLVGNAIKFTEHGGVTIRLRTRQNARQHLVMEVEDTGIGISPENQKRLFQPFVQLTKSSGVQDGTGLGLAITRQFTELMGGKVTVESTPGIGSIFRAEVPVELAAEADIAGTAIQLQADAICGLAPGQPEFRILIVEDQRENQLLLMKLMNGIGINARLAENGAECLKIFEEWRPHLIWMDRRMPVMDGIEATRRIRRCPGGQDVKIIAVTASAFHERREGLLAAGMDDYISKPFRIHEIYDCLAKHLGVKYLYRSGTARTTPEVAAVQLTPAMLTVLPAAFRAGLRAALESLDSSCVAVEIEKAGKLDAELGRALTLLASDFNYPAILNMLGEERHPVPAAPAERRVG